MLGDGIMASVNFKVRQICSAEEIAAVFIPRTVELGWKPGALDHVSFFSTDGSGFFAGEIVGKVINSLSVVKNYAEDYAFIGQYIVDNGLATWIFSFSSVLIAPSAQ